MTNSIVKGLIATALSILAVIGGINLIEFYSALRNGELGFGNNSLLIIPICLFIAHLWLSGLVLFSNRRIYIVLLEVFFVFRIMSVLVQMFRGENLATVNELGWLTAYMSILVLLEVWRRRLKLMGLN